MTRFPDRPRTDGTDHGRTEPSARRSTTVMDERALDRRAHIPSTRAQPNGDHPTVPIPEVTTPRCPPRKCPPRSSGPMVSIHGAGSIIWDPLLHGSVRSPATRSTGLRSRCGTPYPVGRVALYRCRRPAVLRSAASPKTAPEACQRGRDPLRSASDQLEIRSPGTDSPTTRLLSPSIAPTAVPAPKTL